MSYESSTLQLSWRVFRVTGGGLGSFFMGSLAAHMPPFSLYFTYNSFCFWAYPGRPRFPGCRGGGCGGVTLKRLTCQLCILLSVRSLDKGGGWVPKYRPERMHILEICMIPPPHCWTLNRWCACLVKEGIIGTSMFRRSSLAFNGKCGSFPILSLRALLYADQAIESGTLGPRLWPSAARRCGA